jgi:predicted NBD/HSP70 family sugar kinase
MENLKTIRSQNEKLVLQQLFNHESISRAQIADILQLHKSTISSIFDNLVGQDLVKNLGLSSSGEQGGRPSNLLQFNENLGYVISFDIGRFHLRAANLNFRGQLIEYQSFEITNYTPQQILDLIIEIIPKLKISGTVNGLAGIGLSIHGIVNNQKVVYSPQNDFSQVDLVEVLNSKFNVPILIENEANLSAIYQRDFTAINDSETYDDFVAINIHDGIGAGIIIDNQLHRGLNGEAGEFGRTLNFLNNRRVEEYLSEDALINRVGKTLNDDEFTRDKFLRFYQGKNPEIILLTKDWVQGLAQLIFNTVQTLSPDVV